MPEAADGQRTRFRAVIGADQQSFALRRLPGLWAALQAVITIFFDFMAVLLVSIAIVMFVPGPSQQLDWGIGWLMCGLLMVWFCVVLQFRRPVVSVTPAELRARGALGLTRRAQWSEIASIDLRSRTYGRAPTAVRVPYVRKTGGGGFWLDALAGDTERRPPDPAQLEVLRRLQAMVNVTEGGPKRQRRKSRW